MKKGPVSSQKNLPADPAPTIDWAYWARLPRWKMKEAAALLLRRSPDGLKDAKVGEESDEYIKLLRYLKRARKARQFKSKKPLAIIEWALANGLEIPPEFANMRNGKPPRNWKAIAKRRLRTIKGVEDKEPSPKSKKSMQIIILALAERTLGLKVDNVNSKDTTWATADKIEVHVVAARFKLGKQTIHDHLKNALEDLADDRSPLK